MKNQVTGNFILNAKSEDAESKTFIENGLQWEYSIDGEKETLKTSGPLHESIVVLVSEDRSGSSLFFFFSLFILPSFLIRSPQFVPGHSPGRRCKDQLDI